MLTLLVVSFVLRLAATIWGGLLAYRHSDWRIAAFAAAVGLSIPRVALNLSERWELGNALRSGDLSHGLDLGVALLCFIAAGQGQKILKREARDHVTMRNQSEERTRRFAELREDGVWIVDLSGRTIYANQVLGKLMERETSELTDIDWLDIWPAERHAELKAAMGQLPSQQVVLENVAVRKPNGANRWVRLHLAAMYAEYGSFANIVASVTDVTPQRVTRLALGARRRMLESMAQGTPLEELLCMVVLDLEQLFPGLALRIRTLDVDRGTLQLSRPQGEARGARGPFELAIPKSEPTPRQVNLLHPAIQAFMANERFTLNDVEDLSSWAGHALAASRNHRGWVEVIYSSSGKAIGTLEQYVGDARPTHPGEVALGETMAHFIGLVIERCRTEQALNRTQRMLEATLEESQAGILVVDSTGERIRVANAAARMLLGDDNPEQPELKGLSLSNHYQRLARRCPDGIPIPDDQMPIMRSLRYGQTCHDQEIRVQRPDGRWIWILVNTAPLFDEARRVEAAVAVFLDVTSRKENEGSRERLLQRLETQNLELEEVFRAASHDLRSPLVNMSGFGQELSLAIQDLGKLAITPTTPAPDKAKIARLLEEEIPSAMGFIQSSTDKMDRLLRGLSVVSRYGAAELQMQRVAIRPLIERIIRELSFPIQAASAKVEVLSLPDCLGDENELAQVFTNLIDNALKYLSPERSGLVTINGLRSEDQVLYRVTDNGIGIDQRHQGKVFETFRRLDPDGKIPGEGLGLSILSRIVGRHGGQAGLESEPNRGSTFWVKLPAVE